MAQADTAGSFKAQLTQTSGSLTVGQLVSLPNTPGNVGVCLSGGGSRALSAGMGIPTPYSPRGATARCSSPACWPT